MRTSILNSLCLIFSVFFSYVHAAPVIAGKVLLAAGESSRIHPDDTLHPIQRGDNVFVGDQLQTGQGSITLRMRDQAIVSLRPNSRLSIQAYHPATENQAAAIKMELQQGVIRTKTGQIGSSAPERYRLNTPFAALGIRGTDYSLQLKNNQIDLFVHEGTVNLAPFSANGLCAADSLGPCQTALATDLKAGDGSWLRLEAGSTVERIHGIPAFLQLEDEGEHFFRSNLFTPDGTPLEPVASLSQQFYSEPDGQPSTPTEPDTPPVEPQPPVDGYWTEFNPIPLSEEAIREHFRRTAMTVDAYQPTASLRLFNVNLTIGESGKQRYLSSWFDTSHQRLWGKSSSLDTLLAARFWPEGKVWSAEALPASLESLKGENIAWLHAVSQNSVELWHMPLAEHSLIFTPENEAPLVGTHGFKTSWVQPLTEGSTPQDFAISQFKADKGRFSMVVSSGNNSYTLRGAVGDSGILLGSSDQFEVRGHQDGGTLLLMITDHTRNQQWMLGLHANGEVDSALGAQWQNRQTGSISWGHWADFARLDQQQVVRLLSSHEQLLHNRHFALALQQNQNLPSSGSVGFQLGKSQAIYASAGGYRPATVSDGQLHVNFDQQTFDTSFKVTAPGLDVHNVAGQGQLTPDGILQGDNEGNTLLQGAMGDNGDAAALLFEHYVEDGYFSGITHWK